MDHVTKWHTLDDRYYADGLTSPCVKCSNVRSFCRHICTAYPEELPPEYWNGEKPCPKREEKPDSLPQKN